MENLLNLPKENYLIEIRQTLSGLRKILGLPLYHRWTISGLVYLLPKSSA